MTPPKVTVVHIISVSYSGSTWLNLLLGAHREAFSVGEMTVFARQGTGYCKFHGNACPFWQQFDSKSDENPFLQIHRLCGKRVLVVNNSPGFIAHQDHPEVESRFIHLVRDGRAVAASTLRKYPGRTMWHAARGWARATRKDVGLLARLAAGIQTRVHYEQLVADTAGLVERLSDFIGYGYEPSVLEHWEESEHFLGGGAWASSRRSRTPRTSASCTTASRRAKSGRTGTTTRRPTRSASSMSVGSVN